MFKWPRMEGVVESLTKTNAIYPLLIGLFFTVLIFVATLAFADNIILEILTFLLPAALVYQILRSYQYFATENPDMLRTETHVLQKQVLKMIGDDQHPLSDATTAMIVATVNPANPLSASDLLKIESEKLLPSQEKDHE